MAVENTATLDAPAGAPRVADDVNELVSYAIVRGMLAPEDAIWAYNAILERIGEDGPAAPSSAVFLENGYQLSPTRDLAADEPPIEIAFPTTRPPASTSRTASSASPPWASRTAARRTPRPAVTASPRA